MAGIATTARSELRTGRCLRCGMQVAVAVDPAAGPGVGICPYCQAEVPFGGQGGELADRVVFADRTHPAETGATPESAGRWARCINCGTRVPLLGATPAERTHSAPLDIADTVTCPDCGIEVPAVAEEPGSAMSVLDAIYQRRSVRSYTSEPVDRDTVQRLLDAAVRAPSARNTQPWAFVVVQDRQRLRRYAERTRQLYLAEPPPAALTEIPRPVLRHFRHLFASPAYEVFHGAGTLIVIYAETAEGIPDCYLAAENLMLAACAMGLGTCPIGLARPCLEEPDIRAELGVPAGMVVALPIVVGVPATTPQPVERRPARVISWR